MNETIMMTPAAILERAAASVTEDNVLPGLDGPRAEDAEGHPVHPQDAAAIRRTAAGHVMKEGGFADPAVLNEAFALVDVALFVQQARATQDDGPLAAAGAAEIKDALLTAAGMAVLQAGHDPGGSPGVA